MIQFVVIEDELIQLYEFCFKIQIALLKEVEWLEDILSKLEENPNEIYNGENKLGFSNIESSMLIREFQQNSLNNSCLILVPLNQVLLISIFLEKSLKRLCFEQSKDNDAGVYGSFSKNIKQFSGQTKIHTYINYLKANCSLKIETNEELNFLNDRIRAIRNCFAHGDWDVASEMLKEIDVNNLFFAISKLFYKIESAINDNSA